MNLTITVEDEVLKRARMRALEENTSVNAVLRKCAGPGATASRPIDDPNPRVQAVE